MQSAVLPYLAYRLTDSPFFLGLVGFASTIPILLFTLPGGVLVERWDKRKTVLIFQIVMMLQAFTLAFLTISGRVNIWHIISLAFVIGIAYAFEITARQSMFVELVDKPALPNAIGLNSTIFNIARVIGPTLAAPFLILLKNTGEGWAFFANGISYLFVIVGLLLMKIPAKERPQQPIRLEDFKIGQRFIFSHRNIGRLILMITIPGFIGWPFIQQIPVFAASVFAVAGEAASQAATRNSLMLTMMGVGAFAASILLTTLSQTRRKSLLLTISQYVFSVSMLVLGFTKVFSVASFLMIFIGIGTVAQLILTNTLIQLQTPDELRGRVISTYLWAFQGVAPFGSLLIGWITQNWGISVAVMIAGIGCLVGQSLLYIQKSTAHKTGQLETLR